MKRALILVDLQNDFLPGGALGIAGADAIIPVINQLIPHFPLVVATQDWHPSDHVSFASNHPGKKVGDRIEIEGVEQILWPVHCVRNSLGAELSSALNQERIESFFFKGTDQMIDSYSAFFDNARRKSTGLADYLKSREVTSVYLAGLATDYCVLYSALDALYLGFQTTVISDACRAINLRPQDEELALAAVIARGGQVVSSQFIFKHLN